MKPYWPRSLQLMPAALQERDGYVEELLMLRTGRRVSHTYGIVDLALGEGAGAEGEIVVQRLEAILPSGMVVSVDAQAPLRRAVAEGAAGGGVSFDVYVGAARTVLRGPNVSPAGSAVRSTRYVAAASKDAADLPWMCGKPEILFEGEPLEGFEVLRLGRVHAVGKSVRFEREALPTALRVGASSALEEGLRSLLQAFEARRRELVHYRGGHPLKLGAVVAGDLPGLQLSVIVQRYLPVLAELASRHSTHPHELYETLVAVHGALLVFGRAADIPPPYDHDEQGRALPWLFERIARLVDEAARDATTVLAFQRVDATTFRLAFERSALAGKRPLLVLSGAEEAFLRDRVPSLLKMASPNAIAPLLNSAVGGVAVAVEFEPPPAVPTAAGTVAYRIDVRDALWLDIEDRTQIQLNLLGAPASLEAFLYGIERLV